MTTATAPGPTLAGLGDEERYERFDRLQERMRGVWEIMERNEEDQSVVVIPSVSVDHIGERSGSLQQAYEERFLVLLLLLRQPRLRMIYVTSMPIAPKIVEYYLALLTEVIPSHARARLSLISVGDASPRPLSEKLLERPRLLSQIRSLVPDPLRSHLVPYNTTPFERDLAIELGIPMFAADPRCFPLGTKSGCRKLFADLGVRHPLGFENLRSMDDVAGALMRLRAARPDVTQALVKLNEGVSGEGNAVVDLRDLPVAGSAGEREEITRRAREMAFELPGTAFGCYAAKLAERGGVVEERISGAELRSPSVQLRITPFGEAELLSTHDQVLGGPSGQSYLGCSFPADVTYATQVRSGCVGAGFDEGEPLVAEVSDDLQAAAEGFDVGGQGAQFGGARLGVLDGGHPALGDTHPGSDLGLSDAEAAAHLSEPEGALLGAQLLHPGGDGGLVSRIGIELGEELIPRVVVELAAAHRISSCFR